MRRLGCFMMVFFMAGLLFSGCSYTPAANRVSAPGQVLESSVSGEDTQKVVTFMVIGKGLEPENTTTIGEAKLLAERAAIADGYRQFVEKIRGVYVDASMKSGFGSINHDEINTKTQSWLRGVEIIEIKQGEYNITEAHMRLRINFTKKGMVWWPSGIGESVVPS
jgi:hypothetical protein